MPYEHYDHGNLKIGNNLHTMRHFHVGENLQIKKK